MKRNVISFLMVGALWLSSAHPMPAAEPAQTVEAKLRDKLRATMLQLRAAETDRAVLQAAQAQSADEKKILIEKIDLISKESAGFKLTAKAVEGLKATVSHQEQELAQLKNDRESCRVAAEAARKKEADRAKVVEEVVTELQRLVADRQAKNLALYKLANEILQRYEKFGLGDALSAREPFTGITRVKLQNLVQDYQDKLLNERLTLNEQDLASYRDRLLNPPLQASQPTSGAAGHASE
jgi:hypothetical protein